MTASQARLTMPSRITNSGSTKRRKAAAGAVQRAVSGAAHQVLMLTERF